MRHLSIFQGIVCFILIFAIAPPVLAGEPTDQVKQTTDKVIAVLTDPALEDIDKTEEKRKLLRQIADERFDWEEMARRALARHWADRTDEEKREFVSLFSDLLERTYMGRVDNYSGEEVLYEGETVDGDYGIVRVRVLTATDTEIAAEYRVRRKENGWFIYDVSIEGVSLINNYRTQFNSIILNSSYETLVKRLRAKVDEK
jgi:phospholipid transport system substrate-binding protein